MSEQLTQSRADQHRETLNWICKGVRVNSKLDCRETPDGFLVISKTDGATIVTVTVTARATGSGDNIRTEGPWCQHQQDHLLNRVSVLDRIFRLGHEYHGT